MVRARESNRSVEPAGGELGAYVLETDLPVLEIAGFEVGFVDENEVLDVRLALLVDQVVEVGPDRLGVLGVSGVLDARSRGPIPLTPPVGEEHDDAFPLADVELPVQLPHLMRLEVEYAIRDQGPASEHHRADDGEA